LKKLASTLAFTTALSLGACSSSPESEPNMPIYSITVPEMPTPQEFEQHAAIGRDMVLKAMKEFSDRLDTDGVTAPYEEGNCYAFESLGNLVLLKNPLIYAYHTQQVSVFFPIYSRLDSGFFNGPYNYLTINPEDPILDGRSTIAMLNPNSPLQDIEVVSQQTDGNSSWFVSEQHPDLRISETVIVTDMSKLGEISLALCGIPFGDLPSQEQPTNAAA